MADMNQKFFPTGASVSGTSYDAGLRAHMQRVFNYMGGGLLVTGLVAFFVAHLALTSPGFAQAMFGSPLRWIAMLSPLVFMLVMNFRMQTLSAGTLRTLFWCFCACMGLSMASLFLVFTGASVARAFFITAATFGTMSLWGYTTKKDLTAFGSFFMMGVIGILIASVVNMFLLSSALQWVVSVAGVAIFTGLTAYDVQRIKQTYSDSWGGDANDKLAVFSALSLYLNFINAFQFILELTGGVRRN